MNDIFVIAEQRDGEIQSITYELLGAARSLAELKKQNVSVLLMGSGIEDKAESLISYGADTVYVADDSRLKYYLTEPYADSVAYAARTYSPDVMLIGATSIGRDLAPRVSSRLNTGLTADCTKLEMCEDGLHMTRPAFGGNLFATILCPDHRPQMSTVRPGVMKKAEFDASRKGKVEKITVPFGSSRVQLIDEVREEVKNDKIEDAKMLVSVGRGVKRDFMGKVEELATELGATISSSRAMVDAGITAPDRQVGQTGKTVRPQCYLALGISGAVQHLAGMEESEFIIAVNTDKTASIFSVADMGIVGDVKKIVPLLKDEIEKIKKS